MLDTIYITKIYYKFNYNLYIIFVLYIKPVMQKDAIEIFSIYAQIFFWISSYFYIEIFKNQTSDLYCIITSTFIIKNTPISSRSVFMADFIGFPLNT